MIETGAREEPSRPARLSAEVSALRSELDETYRSITELTNELAAAIKDRLRMERQVRRAQKLESLEVLAGGIAHDFNNLLMSISANAELSLDLLPPRSQLREPLEDICTASTSAAGLVKQILDYSGQGRYQVQPHDLSGIVREMSKLFEVAPRGATVIRYDLAEDLPAIEADDCQIQQVVMNLITNASEAVGDGGEICISTGVTECDPDDLSSCHIKHELPEGPYAWLEISDTGCGMTEEVLRKMCDPFFTTKFTGRGLGMAAVHGIIRNHRGAMMVHSVSGEGTTFRILLPVVDRRAKPRGRPDSSETRCFGNEITIMVVDDEELVLKAARRILEQNGYTVLTASGGQEALAIYEEQKQEIACVLLDLTMPGMGGEQTYYELKRLNPEIRVVLTSGYCEAEVPRCVTEEGLAGFIQKPFDAAQIQDLLKETLQH